jgi:hypothetical protein
MMEDVLSILALGFSMKTDLAGTMEKKKVDFLFPTFEH